MQNPEPSCLGLRGIGGSSPSRPPSQAAGRWEGWLVPRPTAYRASSFPFPQETKGSVAVRVALGETQLVQEVRRFLIDNGVSLDSFSQVGVHFPTQPQGPWASWGWGSGRCCWL